MPQGAVRFLIAMPDWALFVALYVVCVGILPIGRLYFEGLPYNVSFASVVGDVFLIGIVAMSVNVAQDYPGVIDVSSRLQVILFAISVAIGMATWLFLPAVNVMDRYHNLVVVPLLFFLLAVSAVIIYRYGFNSDKVWAIAFFLIWVLLLWWDIKSGRLDQRYWLSSHGLYPW